MDCSLPWAVLCPVVLCPGEFSGQNTGVGCHFLTPGNLPSPGTEPHLLPWRQILYSRATREAPILSYLNQIRNTRDRRRGEPQHEKAASQIQMWAVLQQGCSANYGPLPVCVNKVLLEHTHRYTLICLQIAYDRFWTADTDVRSCDKDYMALKAWNICSLALYRKKFEDVFPVEPGFSNLLSAWKQDKNESQNKDKNKKKGTGYHVKQRRYSN